MIGAQDLGLSTQYGLTFWIMLVGLIAAVALILVMANTLRRLQAENRRLLYNEQIYLNEVPDTQDVWIKENTGGNTWTDPVDEVGLANELDEFFGKHPGVDPKAKRNT